jgi:hypothetical protein
MSGRPTVDDALADPSDVRFGMRGLLLAMTVVAIAMGILGTLYRNFNPASRATVATMWGLCALIVLGRVGYCAYVRIHLERMAGHTICVLAPRGVFGAGRKPWTTVLVGLILAGLGVYYLALATAFAGQVPPGTSEPLRMGLLPCVAGAALISVGTVTIWWNRTVQLREQGVLRGLRLLRWTHITKHYWDKGAVIFEGIDQRHRDVQLAAVAEEIEREKLIRLLDHKISSSGWLALQRPRHGNEGEEELALVPIRTGREVTMRGMASAFVTYMALIVLLAIRPWGPPSREFVTGVGIGIGGSLLWLVIGARRIGAAGRPIVRLGARLDWPTALVALVAVVGCYYVNQQLLFFNDFVSNLLGLGSGIGVSVLAGMVRSENFDLCDNGVVLHRWKFLSWARISVLKWNRDGNGALLLRSGWRRLTARVPAAHRDVVDQVLREKIGAPRMPKVVATPAREASND